jgi:hypothetical protein
VENFFEIVEKRKLVSKDKKEFERIKKEEEEKKKVESTPLSELFKEIRRLKAQKKMKEDEEKRAS